MSKRTASGRIYVYSAPGYNSENAGRSPFQRPLEEYSLVDDYARLLKQARSRANQTLEQLSHAVGLRTNELHSFEEGRTKPTLTDAHKL